MLKTLIGELILAFAAQAVRPPQSVIDELLSADRRFAAEAGKTTVIPALSAMFADDVVMPIGTPKPGFAKGKPQAIEALKVNPDNAQGRLEWMPVRAGVSADGLHGFTAGYMTLTRPDQTKVSVKYLAYWIRKPEGWRIAVYKRAIADQSPGKVEAVSTVLAKQGVTPINDGSQIARHKAALEAAEKAFSDEAQKIGLGPAFAKHGHAEAINLGPRNKPLFTVSAAEIGKMIGADSPSNNSPVSWAADEGSIVSSSGDIGVTFGFIRQNKLEPGSPAGGVPFITVWFRSSPNEPWRYIAE